MPRSALTAMVDAVCGRHMTEAQAPLRTACQGKAYPFCAEHSRMLFSLCPGAFSVDLEPVRADDAPE
jgi:YHS domain-containing protein